MTVAKRRLLYLVVRFLLEKREVSLSGVNAGGRFRVRQMSVSR